MKALLITACGCTREMEIGEGHPPGMLKVCIQPLRSAWKGWLDTDPTEIANLTRSFVLIGHPTAQLAIYQESI